MALNVNRSVVDMFYRYKMPKLLTKVEGKGNGLKTVMVNITNIAKALGRPPEYPMKYFGFMLGTQTQISYKKNGRFIVNGCHEVSKLQDLLDGFIKKFVLCQNCDNPETVLNVRSKSKVLNQVCSACGYTTVINSEHRLINYMIKHPDKNHAEQNTSITNIKFNKKKNPKTGITQESLVAYEEFKDMCKDSNSRDDEQWSVDVSKEAVRNRRQNLSDGVKRLFR